MTQVGDRQLSVLAVNYLGSDGGRTRIGHCRAPIIWGFFLETEAGALEHSTLELQPPTHLAKPPQQ
jgi:hypothetical protein